ncbi:hypothetical protein Xhom_00276 [Xenorhabdus hominickii]|uniref:Uncharacterized protein n=1 Tax=Xenorhabdus hominickii TaxID=351679 RepID=A0A2G0Q7Y2_XENHO|nr:hypothetical protein Xhom_02059 [Xenorhabdus hominickii]PHM57310.1 hypothetical protein Xhom_00276 [Xenorhabdus hominickii]
MEGEWSDILTFLNVKKFKPTYLVLFIKALKKHFVKYKKTISLQTEKHHQLTVWY